MKHLDRESLTLEIEYFVAQNNAGTIEAMLDALPTETLKELNLHIQAILVDRYSNVWRKYD